MRNFLRLIALATLVTSFTLLAAQKDAKPSFPTSDRCLACHNNLKTLSGKDVSIGFDWRASIMANAARDPYWQASVRREDIDHPESKATIEDECSTCHMPIARFEAKVDDKKGQVFAHLPFANDPEKNASAKDGVSCSICHQVDKDKLGTRESFNGGFVVKPPQKKGDHPEYGPFPIANGQAHIMQTSTGGFRPTQADHIHDSSLCGTCHTLYTKSLGPGGKELGLFPEQMPFLEWQHSDYVDRVNCQSCHMPQVQEDAPISAVLGPLHSGVRQHTFVGANFFMLNLLNLHRDGLDVDAMPLELSGEAQRTAEFLQSQAARVTLHDIQAVSSRLDVDVLVENLTGHKLPTAYPSRRAWLHLLVRDAHGRPVFESGALNPDGSIQGNDNDADPSRFELHYTEITSSDQVQIYEPILGDAAGHVTTGLSDAVRYLKDNRLLPHGFQKQTANEDIAVIGEAAEDPNFTDNGDLVRYSVPVAEAQGPVHIEVELMYQPIGFRWAHNLAPYQAMETQRFLNYYKTSSSSTAITLARTETRH
jgi:hypothetical protein